MYNVYYCLTSKTLTLKRRTRNKAINSSNKTQCILSVTKVYFKSNFYDNNNNKYKDG